MSAKPAKPAAAPAKEEAAAPAPNKSKKLLIIIIAVLVLVIAGGAGWYFTKGKAPADHAAEQQAKVEPPKQPKFVTLEPFTVNLQREEGDQYLQIGITLKILEPEWEEKIKAVLPEIRSKLLLLLSSKRASELSSGDGKKKLANEIITETNAILGIHKASAPVIAAASAAPAAAPAAPHEGESAHEGAAPAEHAAEEHHAETPAPAKNEAGIVDVLFTSFIIQ